MGKFTFEGQGAYTYLVYQMDENDQPDHLGLGMLTSNKIPGLLPVLYTQMDGQGYVKYNISSKICAKNFFAGAINRKRLLGVFSGVAEALMSADDYMLDRNSILLDLDYIYADVTTCDASLVSVPVLCTQENPIDAGAFFKQLIFTAQFDQTENCDYVTKILNYLNSTPLFSLSDFKGLVDGLRREETAQPVQPAPVQPAPVQSAPVRPASVRPTPVPLVKVDAEPPVQVSRIREEIPVSPAAEVKKENIPVNIPVNIPGLGESAVTKEPAKAKGFSLFGSRKKETEEKTEKKSLFGMKSAPEKKPVLEKKPSLEKRPVGGGFSIPGMEDMEIPTVTPKVEKPSINPMESVRRESVSPMESVYRQSVKPVENVNKQPEEQINLHKISSYTPEQPVTVRSSAANFGNTVNLSKSNVGKTTMLPRGNKAAEVKPSLVRVSNNERIYVTKALFHIGQEPGYADYCIMDNPAVSHAHADISVGQDGVTLMDTGSTNGTYVNGQILNANVPVYLKHGDKVTLADEEFVFYLQ